jgi:hypothetical protein
MNEKTALKVFWFFMLACASTAIVQIWSSGNALPMQIVPTFFVIGFASFLIWAPLMVYKFLAKF